MAACWITAGVFLWRTKTPSLQLEELDPSAYFSAADLDRIASFRSLTRALWAGARAVELITLGLLVWKAGPLARGAERLLGGRVRTAVSLGLVAVALIWLATLPLDAVSHWWRRRYGLSRQGYGGWLGDQATSLGLRAVLVSIAVAGAVALATWLGRRWWLVGGPALAAIGVLFVLAQPLVVQPLFNRFEPVADRGLAAEIQALARPLGVQVDTVQVADASRRTTTANAYVAGIGPTRRVVLYDTLLDGRFSRGEILAVSAHELAHVGRRHLWKGVAWFALFAIPGVFLVAVVTGRRGGLKDPALVPLGLLVALVFSLATQPLQNTISRRYEAEADWLALTATQDRESAVGLYRKLARSALGDPDPPGWARLWLSTHPSTMERIAMANAFSGRTPAGS